MEILLNKYPQLNEYMSLINDEDAKCIISLNVECIDRLTETINIDAFNVLVDILLFSNDDYEVYFITSLLSNMSQLRSDEMLDENIALDASISSDPDYRIVILNNNIYKYITRDFSYRNLDDVVKDQVLIMELVRSTYMYVPKILKIEGNLMVLEKVEGTDVIEYLSDNQDVHTYTKVKRRLVNITNKLDSINVKFSYKFPNDIIIDKYYNLWLTNFTYATYSTFNSGPTSNDFINTINIILSNNDKRGFN